MKQVEIYLVAVLCGSADALWSPFNELKSRPVAQIYGKFSFLVVEMIYIDPASFNPVDLLRPKNQKSEIYNLALTGLQNLHKESSCHRLAANLYTTNCQLLEDFEARRDASLPLHVGDRLRDYIHSFAASLAICDLEAAHATVPESCELFREPALLNAATGNSIQGLHVSHEQIGLCMNGLHSKQNSWTSFNSNKDTAALFCRVSRIDIEKDDFISTMQAIIGIIQEMDLAAEQRKHDLAEEELATKIHFRGVHEELSDMKDGILSMWDKISQESARLVKGVLDTMRSTSENAEAADLAMKRILKSMVEGNAEHASTQQKAVAATTDLAVGAQNANLALVGFRQLLVEVAFNVWTTMGTALSAIEQRHVAALKDQVTQTQNLMKSVREELNDAKEVISEVRHNAEKTAEWISDKSTYMLEAAGPGGISWLLLILAPFMTVILGGYGIPASYTRNFGLLFIGLMIAKVLTLASNGQWQANAMTPSAFTQLARDKISPIVLTSSVDFEIAISSAAPESLPIPPADIR